MTPDPTIRTLGGSTATEAERKLNLAQRLRQSRVPDQELLDNLGLYLTRQTLSRINFMQKLYAMIVPVHGVIMEFGVRWGQNMALFTSLGGYTSPSITTGASLVSTPLKASPLWPPKTAVWCRPVTMRW